MAATRSREFEFVVVLLWRPEAGTRALVVGGIGMSRWKFES
jgi:hypothetical protein